MATELDTALNNVVGRLTAPGAMLETVPFERFGRELPMLKNAPPTLPAMFEQFCAQHGDAEFLVDGDIRTTFAQAYAAAREVVWVQEEPANMGALLYVLPRLRRMARPRPVRSVKRSASASAATGSAKAHEVEQKTLLTLAFARSA